MAATTSTAKPATTERKPPTKATPELAEAVRLAREIRGAKAGASSGDHLIVRRVAAKELKARKLDLTPQHLAVIAGAKNPAELRAMAQGKLSRAPISVLSDKVKAAGGSKWTWGMQCAAILSAWIEQLQAADKPAPKPRKPKVDKPAVTEKVTA